jgi:hypothetical protein
MFAGVAYVFHVPFGPPLPAFSFKSIWMTAPTAAGAQAAAITRAAAQDDRRAMRDGRFFFIAEIDDQGGPRPAVATPRPPREAARG